jgi:ABC-type amino acid transport substrate-binding protein
MKNSLSRTVLGFALVLVVVIVTIFVIVVVATSGTDNRPDSVLCTEFADVPELQDGELSIGSELGFEPMNFINSETSEPDGFEIEFARALANELCIDVRFVPTLFDDLLDDLNGVAFDVIISGMTVSGDSAEVTGRNEAADFVPYIQVGSAILVRSGNPHGVEELEEDLCGLTVAVQAGTIQLERLREENDTCSDEMDILVFQTHEATMLDLTVSGSEASMTDFPVAFLAAKDSNGRLVLVEGQVDQEDYGIGVRKSSEQLKSALTRARDNLFCNGKYIGILTNWNLRASKLDEGSFGPCTD